MRRKLQQSSFLQLSRSTFSLRGRVPNLTKPDRCPCGGQSGGLAHMAAVHSHIFHAHRILTLEVVEDTIVAVIILPVYGRSLSKYP